MNLPVYEILKQSFPEFAKEQKLAFVNFQTTGLDASESQIFEVGVLIWNTNESRLNGYSEYINIDEPVNYYMGEILKVDQELLRAARGRDEVMSDFFKYIDGYLICAYNSDFVRAFMRIESIRQLIEFNNDFFCIKKYVESKIPTMPSLKLDDVARALGVEIEYKSNRAITKAEKAYRVLIATSKFDVATDKLLEHEDCTFYTYAHLDESGNYFYVGVGHGDIAWGKERHRLWHRYVDNHLNGSHTVKIIKDKISSSDASLLKDELLKANCNKLVNVVNNYRSTDFKEMERISFLASENEKKFNDAIELSKNSPIDAIPLIIECINALDFYRFSKTEYGLLGALIDEEKAEIGSKGNLKFIDALTKIMKKLGRIDEARDIAEEYFYKFKLDSTLKSSASIKKRVGLL